MKAYFSVIIFVVLVASSVITGTGNYMKAQGRITSDLNRALMYALAEKGQEWVTEDTVRVCRRLYGGSRSAVTMTLHDIYFSKSLTIPELRDDSYISFAVLPDRSGADGVFTDTDGVSGDTVVMKFDMAQGDDVAVAFRANAKCSFATVFGLSDQRLPAALCVVSVIWGVVMLFNPRRRVCVGNMRPSLCSLGNLRFDDTVKTFYNSENEEVRFTPMQFMLMEMFFNAEGHKLYKSDICRTLWPGKDNASETLYTLMRRLKRVVEQNTNLRIEVERGRAYKLRVNDEQ